ncbi:MAG: hypothetical protein R3A13_03115 [Bdellovibrionota bacterium]
MAILLTSRNPDNENPDNRNSDSDDDQNSRNLDQESTPEDFYENPEFPAPGSWPGDLEGEEFFPPAIDHEVLQPNQPSLRPEAPFDHRRWKNNFARKDFRQERLREGRPEIEPVVVPRTNMRFLSAASRANSRDCLAEIALIAFLI